MITWHFLRAHRGPGFAGLLAQSPGMLKGMCLRDWSLSEIQGSRTFRFALGWLSLFACGCWLVVPWLLRPHAGSPWVDWPSWTFAFFKVFSVPVRPFNYQWWWATNLLTGVLILRSLRHHLESCLPWCHCVNSFSVLAETLYLFIFTAVIKYTG